MHLQRILRLLSSSGVGAIARNSRLSNVRRVYLHRIGYYLYYRVTSGESAIAQIVAFWHSSRGAGPRL
jgi:hypothetical protein